MSTLSDGEGLASPIRPVRHLRLRRLGMIAAWLIVASLSAATGAALAGPRAAPRGAVDSAAATDVARVLAGLPPLDAARHTRITRSAAWQAYRADVDRNWSRLEAERFSVMREWSSREVRSHVGHCDTLFYPFGGPDFVNAHVLFPDCGQYLLFGLEPVGSVPEIDRGDAAAADALVAELRASLSDVFVRDYFITREMMTELKTPRVNGTLPLLLVFLARLDARIIDIRLESPWSEGDPAAGQATAAVPPPGAEQHPSQRANAVTIRFTVGESSRVQTVSYARVRMEDAEFARQAALVSYLRRQAPFTTLLKSASYLLHDPRFSMIRSTLLSGSRAVLQDDTGVPYRFFEKSAWNLTLFGKYSPPVKDFNYGMQPDLEAAYRSGAGVRGLPFAFGYHWRQGTSSVMLAIRRESAQPPAAPTPPK